MNLHIHTHQLLLRQTFRIAHGSRDSQPTMIVELSEDGFSGLGEATATSYYGLTIEGMTATLEKLRPIIESYTLDTPEQFWENMYPLLKDNPFELCALDIAAHDLYGQKKGQPLYQLWELDLKNNPLSNYTIGIGTIEEMIAKIEAQPWPIYKIKLGTDNDLGIIKALRQHTDAIFRVDANTAWTAEETIKNAPILKDLGVEFIEQPLKAADWEGMKKVYKHSVLPIIADESCQTEADVQKCYGHFHGINIKLMKCGGLTPARRMIQQAKELDLQLMVGCMTESTVGISAIGQLLPLLDYVDMDGPLLIKNDLATGVCIDQGIIHYPDRNGTGARLIG